MPAMVKLFELRVVQTGKKPKSISIKKDEVLSIVLSQRVNGVAQVVGTLQAGTDGFTTTLMGNVNGHEIKLVTPK